MANVRENVPASLRVCAHDLTASGGIPFRSGQVTLNHATVAIAATIDAPSGGEELLIANISASGTAAHTVTLPVGCTWDGTNRVVTLNAPGEFLFARALSPSRWFVIASSGVAFS